MIDNTSYLLVKHHVKAGVYIKVWSNLLVDSVILRPPLNPEGALYSLYEIVTEENRHGGWIWKVEKEIKK